MLTCAVLVALPVFVASAYASYREIFYSD